MKKMHCVGFLSEFHHSHLNYPAAMLINQTARALWSIRTENNPLQPHQKCSIYRNRNEAVEHPRQQIFFYQIAGQSSISLICFCVLFVFMFVLNTV